MTRNQKKVVLEKLKDNGIVFEMELILNHGILPWTLKKIIKSLKNEGYRISTDRLWIDIQYEWADFPQKW